MKSPPGNPRIYLLLLSLLCGLYHLTAQNITPRNEPKNTVPTMTHYRGHPLTPIPLTSLERSFEKNFPGQLGSYHYENDSGSHQLIIRHINQASRKLHPSAHCLRAAGFVLGKPKIVKDAYEESWAEYRATQNRKSYLVRERIINSRDSKQSWTDISAWYWDALKSSHAGPWQAETIIRLNPLTSP